MKAWVSDAAISRYEILETARNPERGMRWRHLEHCVCVGDKDAAHLLLAVKVAARAIPGSFFFRLVGESMLPVLRELECGGKDLG